MDIESRIVGQRIAVLHYRHRNVLHVHQKDCEDCDAAEQVEGVDALKPFGRRCCIPCDAIVERVITRP
jgi:hypothetical protein